MKRSIWKAAWLGLLIAGSCVVAQAEPGDGNGGGRGRRPDKQKILEKFDKDGDGKLSEEEKTEMKKAMAVRRKKALKKYDKDGDGKLSREERKAVMQERRKKNQCSETPAT